MYTSIQITYYNIKRLLEYARDYKYKTGKHSLNVTLSKFLKLFIKIFKI